MLGNFNLKEIPLLVPVSTGVVVGALTSFYLYRKYICHQYFKKRGIPGPEPHWLYGNLLEIWCDNRHEVMAEWSKKYGEFYGYYEGPTPILVTSNLEAVEQICVKQFSNFQGHNLLPIAPDPSETDSLVNHMLWAQGEHWKRLRTAVNPAFSTGKLKSYAPFIAETQADFMELLDEMAKSGKSFDIRESFQLLTLDVIAQVGFGLDFNAIKTKGEGNPVLKALRELFDSTFKANKAMDFLRVFPAFIPMAKAIVNRQFKTMKGMFGSIGLLLDLVGMIIKNRLGDEKARRNDLLQLLIDSSDMVEQPAGTCSKTLICERDIKAMAFLFFFAGYETTSSTLACIAYYLATNQDFQGYLCNEIFAKFPKNKADLQPDYETVMHQMPYLDWICRETMRITSMGYNTINRFILGETQVCGVQVDRGCQSVVVDMWTIHQNPDLWGPVDPKTFYPDRFKPEYCPNRPKAAFLAFGYGPRQCIGKRLAMFEMKLTLVNLLRRFQIVEPDGGYPPGGLKLSSREFARIPVEGVPVKFIPRQ